MQRWYVDCCLRACFENKLGKGLRARRGGWRGATKENIPRGSSTEEQRSQPPAPPQDHPRYLQNTLLALCQARIAGSAAKDVAGRAVIGAIRRFARFTTRRRWKIDMLAKKSHPVPRRA